ncbi:MAG: hypothetical protein ACREFX_04955 [Opitutaceae bacterium]
MEPEDLTPDDAWLEPLLRSGLAETPLPDGGFHGRVMAALPVRRSRQTLLEAATWSCASLGLAVALGACLGSVEWGQEAGMLRRATAHLLSQTVNPWLALGVALASISIALTLVEVARD